MGCTWTVLLLALGCLSVAAGREGLLPRLGKEWSAVEDIEKVLRGAASLSRQSQKVLLIGLGEALVAAGEGKCNLFGGSGSCLPVSAESDYGRLCEASSRLVDCAFRMEAEEHITKDPEAVFRDKVAKEGYPPCSQCYTFLHKFWCAQTVPVCGTFDKVVDEILPVISSVALGEQLVSVALQEAVPRMLQAISLGLPCRKMCDLITRTCGCGVPSTFGEVMTYLEQNRDGYSTNMSAVTSRDIFQKVWDKPVCDLFAEDTIPGFAGVCQVPTEAASCGWCNGKSKPQAIHQQIVAQLAQTFSGMMQGGLEKILSEAGGHKKGGVQSWDWDQQAPASPKKKTKSGHTVALVLLTLLVLMAGAAVFVAVRVNRSRHVPSQYIDLNSMGYTPPIL